jgi:serine/threonine protein kinase/tetratricopeptide (TPR) repeat protein
MPLSPGTRLGPYEIMTPIGAGGMGEVYKARDSRIGRDVAIKLASAEFIDRFDDEIRAVAALNHPNICTLHDVGPNYIVTELVEGETLWGWLMRAPDLERRLGVARQVLEALRAAHSAGFVHRDLKPHNVMVRGDGYVKVLDFGLAKRIPGWGSLTPEGISATDVTLPGQIVGTISYMSPEQIQGQRVDGRSDLFAFGIMLYEMLVGQHPWRRDSAVDTLHAILHEDAPMDPVGSAAGAEVTSVVHKLLRKHPAERYQSAEAVLEALARHAVAQGLDTGAPSSAQPFTSIAVLPFVFLSEVDERKALSLGFADALITILGNLETVTVAPTSAILGYAPGTEPSRVCRDLGVRHTLQGNVQKLGTQWRVSLQLFDAATQRITFSEKHDFRLEDVFEVQDEIGRRVMTSLQRRFPLTMQKSRDRYSSDPEAYNEFMAGLRESYTNTREELQSAARHLARAVELDPEFALAHAWLSQVSTQIHNAFDSRPMWLEKAEDHYQRALNLDHALPEAHWARAAILWSPARNFQHADAIASLERVLDAQPNFDRAHNRMAAICLHIGRFEEARIAHDLAMRSNPKNRSYNLEFISICTGDFSRAEELGEIWVREAQGNRFALWFHPQPPLMTGDLDLAEKRLHVAVKEYADEPLIVSLQGMLHACRKQPVLALQCVRKALDLPISFGHAHHTYEQIACVYAMLGETEKALAWLQRSIDTGNPCWPFFKIHPHLDNLRRESRFQDLMAALEQKYTALQIRRL